MIKLAVIYIVLFFINLQAQQTHQNESIIKQLNKLNSLGIHYNFIADDLIELSDTVAGFRKVKSISETNTEAIHNWANAKGIPVYDFDPALIDTNQWNGWYNYWTIVPVSNLSGGIATKVADFDMNGFPEVYGFFGVIGLTENRLFEVYPDGSSLLRHIYDPHPGGSAHITDVDSNGLKEIVFLRGQNSYFYEQTNPDYLPIQHKFTFTKYDGLAAYLSREQMADMDGDGILDFVHRGADTSISPYYLTYVSEYNSTVNNFVKSWYIEPTIGQNFGFMDGYDIGDYDDDGRMEAISSTLWGKIRIVENTGDNSYAVNFIDSLPLVNMYYSTSGDVDRDGKREFFIGATMGDGNWTVMFETEGDNIYTPKLVLHLLSGGSLDEPTYIVEDIDDDGELELAILSGGYLYIFKSDGDDSYYLWFLKKGPSNITVSFYDMNGDGIKDILWGVESGSVIASNIYTGSDLVNVVDDTQLLPQLFELLQNYPNPFNPSTSIQYAIGSRQNVQLKVYDLLGREVATLVNEEKESGTHTVNWNAADVASGVYIYRLQTESISISMKMQLIK